MLKKHDYCIFSSKKCRFLEKNVRIVLFYEKYSALIFPIFLPPTKKTLKL